MSPIYRMGLGIYETVWHGRKTFKYLAELEKSQWYKRTALDDLRLKSLIDHALQHVPHYTALRAKGDAGPITAPGELSKFPLLYKETITGAFQTFLSNKPMAARPISKTTGGSTGTPLKFVISAESYEKRAAATYRGYGWAGAKIGTKQLHLWGVPLGPSSFSAKVKDRLYHALHRRTVLNSFELSGANAHKYLAVFRQVRPEIVVAYTNPLYEFARELRERGIAPPKPRSIVVGAEKLHDFQRKTIEEVFRAPVYETYGSRESMLIASECDSRRGLHLTHENLLVEIVDEHGQAVEPGSEGDGRSDRSDQLRHAVHSICDWRSCRKKRAGMHLRTRTATR
jgi:phenylacetate-CoA ligase